MSRRLLICVECRPQNIEIQAAEHLLDARAVERDQDEIVRGGRLSERRGRGPYHNRNGDDEEESADHGGAALCRM
ncbi:MAG: hypothetical protein ACRD2X_11560 [Vicinamibacteraceae bacterium]